MATKPKSSQRSAAAQALRERKAKLDAERETTERRVEAALDDFAAAGEALEALAEQCAAQETARAEALQVMREAGRTVEDIAFMTALSVREVRKLTRVTSGGGVAEGDSQANTSETAGESQSSASETANESESGAEVTAPEDSGAGAGAAMRGSGAAHPASAE